MQRRHLIELHEQSWFPPQAREMFQRGLGTVQSALGAYDGAVPKVAELLRRTGARQVLDLCSGSAEVVVAMAERLRRDEGLEVSVRLSDLYPDRDEMERLKRRHPDLIDYVDRPVDAIRPPASPDAIRTLFASLHHFRPDDVRRSLTAAADDAAGIAVFESTGRTWPHMAQMLPLPIVAALVCGLTLRPWHPRHLFWTFGLPLVPLAAVWDGVVSNLRTYTVDELRAITASIDRPGVAWEVGTLAMPRTTVRATYVLGWRR
ncbi:MAG: class I SAM-dependent methyltransferase [Acidobacteriota bacterium]